MHELLKTEEIRTEKQRLGISIISVADSVFLKRKYLFAVGLSANDFPPQTRGSFLLREFESYHNIAQERVFNSWFLRFENLTFTCPQRDIDGNAQQYSMLLEGLRDKKKEISFLQPTLRNQKQQFVLQEQKIKFPQKDLPVLKRQIIRRNTLLEYLPTDTKYFGNLGIQMPELYKTAVFSQVQLNQMSNNPLYFLFESGWKIYKSDFKRIDAIERGIVIHNILEKFGEKEGFELNRKKPRQAFQLLKKCAEDVFSKEKIKYLENAEDYGNYAPFMLGLSEGEPLGLFRKILDEEREALSGFVCKHSERGFGLSAKRRKQNDWDVFYLKHPVLEKLQFAGIIDRIDVNDATKTVLVQDFKTGNVDWNEVSTHSDLQLMMYYLVVKNHFSNYDVLLVYRRAKRLKTNEWGFFDCWLGDTNNELLNRLKSNKKRNISDVETFKNIILDCFNVPFVDGKFEPLVLGAKEKNRYNHLWALSRIETIKYLLDATKKD